MSTGGDNIAAGRSQRITRLAGLCRLWGAIKYFHPYLGYRDIDWDEALVATIPRVEEAVSPADYCAAVDHLLSFLEDPATRTLAPAEPENVAADQAAANTSSPQPSVHYLDDGVALIAATDYAQFQSHGAEEAFRAALHSVENARALVFDLRRLAGSPSWYVGWIFLQAVAPALLAKPLWLAGARRRVHAGHPQHRGPTHGGYYSGWIYEAGAVIAPADQRNPRPLVFLIDAGSADLYRLLGGLQAAGLANVVYEGDPDPGAGVTTYYLELPDGVQVRMRLDEFVYPDGSIGFHPDVVVPAGRAEGDAGRAAALNAVRKEVSWAQYAPAPRPAVPYEQDYAQMQAPAPAYRLLALFRYWNAIHYFFPYKRLLDESWDTALLESIPAFAREGDARDYALTVARLVARIQDTHGSVQSAALRVYLGTHIPPVRVRAIQAETVITDLLADGIGEDAAFDASGPTVGDVVLAVDGEEVAAKRARLAALFAASTPQALSWRVHQALLAGAMGSAAILTLRGADGRVRDVTLARVVERGQRPQRLLPVFGVLSEGFGYMDLERLTIPQVDEAFEAVQETPGLIFDLRGYPNGTAWLIAPWLAEREVVTARFGIPELRTPDLECLAMLPSLQTTAPGPEGRYRGKVVALIDEDAISQTEHTCLFLEAAADVTFIGGPTSGANGNVTNVVLPGGIVAGFTGMEVLHADGRQLQRLGIQPHIRIQPTLAGIRAGCDEVLAGAVAFLQEQTGHA